MNGPHGFHIDVDAWWIARWKHRVYHFCLSTTKGTSWACYPTASRLSFWLAEPPKHPRYPQTPRGQLPPSPRTDSASTKIRRIPYSSPFGVHRNEKKYIIIIKIYITPFPWDWLIARSRWTYSGVGKSTGYTRICRFTKPWTNLAAYIVPFGPVSNKPRFVTRRDTEQILWTRWSKTMNYVRAWRVSKLKRMCRASEWAEKAFSFHFSSVQIRTKHAQNGCALCVCRRQGVLEAKEI